MHHLIVAITVSAFLASCGREPSPAEFLEKAQAHVAEGNFSAATIETRNAVRGDQKNPDARLLLGNLVLQNGDAAGAEKEFRKAIELGIEEASVRPGLADALLRQGKLDKLLALSPDGLSPQSSARLLNARSLGWLASSEISIARQDIAEALKLEPESSAAKLTLARLEATDGNVPLATDYVQDLVDEDPIFGEAWEFLGDLEHVAGNSDNAVNAYSKAIEHSPQPLQSRLKRSQINLTLGKSLEALEDLDVLKNAGLKLPITQVSRGLLAQREADLSAAQVHFEKALTMDPDFMPAIRNLAQNHLLSGSLGQAEQYAKQYFNDSDESFQSKQLLTAIYIEDGRYELAETTITPVVESTGLDLMSIGLLSTSLLKQSKYDEAIGLMADALIVVTGNNILTDTTGDFFPTLTRLPSKVFFDQSIAFSENKTRSPSPDIETEFLNAQEQIIVKSLTLMVGEKHDDALTLAERFQAESPGTAAPHILIGRIYINNGKLEEAYNSFEQAIKQETGNIPAHLALTQLDVKNGDLEEARDRLEKLIETGVQNESIFIQLSQLEAQLGNQPAMLEWIEQAGTTYPESVQTALILARYHTANQNPQAALQALRQLDVNSRNRADVMQLEASALVNSKRFAEAMTKLDTLIKFQPDVAQWRYLRAHAKSGEGIGDNLGMLDDLNAALDLDPNHAPSIVALANADIELGKLQQASARIDTLRLLIPGSRALKQIEQRYADSHTENTLKSVNAQATDAITFESTEQLLLTAKELWSNNQRDSAIVLMTEWLQSNPKDVVTRMTLANSYLEMERSEEAIKHYEIVLQNNEQDLTEETWLVTLNNLAWYLRDVDSNRALKYAKRAIEIAPNSIPALDTLAMIQLSRGDAQAAKSTFDRTRELGVINPTVLYHGASIEHALGNNESALSLLRPLLALDSDFPEKKEAEELLRKLQ